MGANGAAERAIAIWTERTSHPSPGAYAELAIVADAAGDGQGTATALARAAALPGGAAVAQLAHAQILFRHGDLNGAADLLHGLLARNPDDIPALNVLGAAMLSQHRYDEALAAYQHALSLVPHDASLHFRVAVTLHQMGRNREAMQQCSTILSAVPNNADALALEAEIRRGDSFR